MSDLETDDEGLRGRLQALREEPASFEFQSRLHRRLVEAGPPEPVSGWDRVRGWLRQGAPLLWPVSGLALGVAVFFLLGAPREPKDVASEVPGSSVPASKVAVINLDFSADVAVEQADFQVSLPEGLSFWADGEELPLRSFSWSQSLSAGSNVIPVAVRGHKPGRYVVTARVLMGEQRMDHEVVLEVTDG
jgi:hypothetical protein